MPDISSDFDRIYQLKEFCHFHLQQFHLTLLQLQLKINTEPASNNSEVNTLPQGYSYPESSPVNFMNLLISNIEVETLPQCNSYPEISDEFDKPANIEVKTFFRPNVTAIWKSSQENFKCEFCSPKICLGRITFEVCKHLKASLQ